MSNKMWGGRFSERPDAIMEEINVSIDVDRHLYAQDIAASKAHAAMLAAQGIITANDAKNIAKGLDTILSEIGKGSFTFKRALEDIHMNVESRLGELIGPAAGRLHTARSRNDQVATDFRLYVRDVIDDIDAALKSLQHALAERALQHADTVMPGFTHLQTAQPVTFGHHLLAYVEMVARDRGRFSDARKRLNESPLGAAALAGTSFPIDRFMTAEALGFDRPTANSLDSVSDRDFVLETLSAASIAAQGLPRNHGPHDPAAEKRKSTHTEQGARPTLPLPSPCGLITLVEQQHPAAGAVQPVDDRNVAGLRPTARRGATASRPPGRRPAIQRTPRRRWRRYRP